NLMPVISNPRFVCSRSIIAHYQWMLFPLLLIIKYLDIFHCLWRDQQ
ncbi:MAG: hypothetical protein ACI8RD_003133, partial [Bacillariaceae sp.]